MGQIEDMEKGTRLLGAVQGLLKCVSHEYRVNTCSVLQSPLCSPASDGVSEAVL